MLSELIDQHILQQNHKKYSIQHQSLHSLDNLNDNPIKETLIKTNPIQKSLHNLDSIIDSSLPNQPPLHLLKSPSKISQSSSNHTCPQCNKSFYKNAHLIRHISEKHSDTRSFICTEPECGKTFKRDSHLRRHMISHTHQKKFKCSQCIMAFGYKHHLDRHVKTVHERQLLTCEDCGQSFAKKKPFLKHVEKVHSKKLNQSVIVDDSQDQVWSKAQGNQNETVAAKKSNKKKIKKAKKSRKQGQRKEKTNKTNVDDEQSSQKSEKDMIVEQEQSEEMNSKSEEKNQKYEQNEKKGKKDEGILFRCIYSDCVSAFERMHELMRHLKQTHKQNSSEN